jgi:hypothetical protein
MSRVHVLMRSALVTRRPPEVGDYPVHRRAGETTWNREGRRSSVASALPFFRRTRTALEHSP